MKTFTLPLSALLLSLPSAARASPTDALASIATFSGPIVGYELSASDGIDGQRIGPELGGLAISIGASVAMAAIAVESSDCWGESCAIRLVALLAAAIVFVLPAGVTIAGDAAGGDGGYGGALLGNLGGFLVATVLQELGS